MLELQAEAVAWRLESLVMWIVCCMSSSLLAWEYRTDMGGEGGGEPTECGGEDGGKSPEDRGGRPPSGSTGGVGEINCRQMVDLVMVVSRLSAAAMIALNEGGLEYWQVR